VRITSPRLRGSPWLAEDQHVNRDENWRVAARRRQRQRPVKTFPWFVPDGPSRKALVWLAVPFVVSLALVFVSMVLNNRALAYVTVLFVGSWLVGVWLFFDRGLRGARGRERSGAAMLSTDELDRRVRAESSSEAALLSEKAVTPIVAALTWSQYGDLLLEREHQVRGLADQSSWQFDPLDLGTSAMLDRAGATAFTPSTCRNVCRGQHRQVPFILTDLTRTRYDLGKADREQPVELLTATMCAMPFAAPHVLRIVARTHWLADAFDGYEHISTESTRFNAAYRLLGQNNLWTRLVLNPEFLALLMASSVTSLVIDGGQFAVAVEPWQPITRLTHLLELTGSLHKSALTAAAPEAEEPITYFM